MRSFLMLSVGAVALVSTPAAARDGAWYVGGDFGAMIVEDSHVDFNSTTTVTLNHDYGFDGAINVGYDLGAFRLEAEVAYKTAKLDTIDVPFIIPPPAGPAGPGRIDAGGGHTSALSFMVNGMLDFGDDDGISGFVGGGVGVGRVSFNNLRVFADQEPYLDDSDSRFAWQIIAGVRKAISDNIDISLRYRFFNVDNLRVRDIGGFGGDTSFRSHSLLGGITFNFGVPPPPPPPPPPAPTAPYISYFDSGSADITPQTAAILDTVAAAYQTTGHANVVVAGLTDRSGAADTGLAQRRENAVAQYLQGRGVPSSAITTEDPTEGHPLVEDATPSPGVHIMVGPGG